MLIKKMFAICLIALISWHANAGFILNGNSIGTLTLNDDPITFYNYTNGSADTGLEESDLLTFFISEYTGKFYLFGLFDDPDGAPNNGAADLLFEEDSAVIGDFVFIDDEGPSGDYFFRNTSGTLAILESGWASGFSDGFVYEIGGTTGTDITLNFSEFSSVDGLQFLNFDGNDSSVTLRDSFNITYAEVSSPSNLMILSLGLFLAVYLRTKK